ncbi:MAG: putative 2-aminoethylphosphonate ABC transporter permease subunit, partial [Ensifer adhaerens]
MVLEAPHLPLIGKRLRQESSKDDRIKLGFMAVIGLYLVVALGAPLFVMLSKSLSTYRFELSAFEFQVSDETGANWGPVVTAEDLNRELGAVTEAELSSSSDGRLAATKLFPDFKFRSPVHYRIRGTNDDAAFLVGSTLEKGTEWRDYDSGTFRRVVLRPARALGFTNFTTYFSTPALAQSIYNSVLMAVISTVFTISVAFALAYGLTRSCMPLKGLFRGILTIPILVPSLLPGIALVYLFGN